MSLFLSVALCLAQAGGQSQPVVRNLVIVSGKEWKRETSEKAFKATSVDEVLLLAGKANYRVEKQGEYTFVIQKAAVGSKGLSERKALLDAIYSCLQSGKSVLDLGQMKPEEAKPIRDALRMHADQIPAGMKPLIDEPNLRISLEPVVTASFDGPGGRKVASAYPVHNDQEILTPASGGSDERQTPPKQTEPVDARDGALRFYFSRNLESPSSQLKAMQEFAAWSDKYLKEEVEAFNSSYSKTLAALFESNSKWMGEGIPPKTSDVSKLSKALQDSFARSFSSMFGTEGFDSRSSAETWLYQSKMVSSSSYINLVFGGRDLSGNGNRIGSIIFDRP